MSERRTDNLTPDYGDFPLADLLEAYRRSTYRVPGFDAPAEERGTAPAPSEPEPEPEAAPEPEQYAQEAPPETPEEIAARSRRAVMDAFGQTLRQYESARTGRTDPEPEEAGPEAEAASEPKAAPAFRQEETPPEEPAFSRPRLVREEERPGTDDTYEEAKTRERPRRTQQSKYTPESFSERFLAPVVRLVATRLARRQAQTKEAANWPEPVELRETPELTARKAGKFYASLVGPLRLRARVSLFLCLILVWISFHLPMAGMLGQSLPIQAGVSLVVTLAIMVAALDVVSVGIRQLLDLQPAAEALAALSALLSCIDAVLVLFGIGDELPFCAISGVTLTAALWGERLTCTARRRTFKTAAASKNPAALTYQELGGQDGKSLRRSDRDSMDGIVRRSESQDMCQTAYSVAAPIMLLAALILAILAAVSSGHFLHTWSALTAVSASFTAFISFPLPYAVAARRLRNAGAALAGFAGCADIGRTHRVIITDEDLFPPGTMRFTEINILEGMAVSKVVSYTAALLKAYGSGVSTLFDELVERRGYHIPHTERFDCQEGGGLSAFIDGERVHVGSVGFMNLMGIRLPTNLQTKNTICTAIGGELVGVFAIEYVAVTSVQDALVMLLRGRTQTVFALRDFNINPAMIRKLFRIPTENFSFPSFQMRYRIAASPDADERPLSAVLTRSGMLPLVEAAETGRRLYTACRAGTVLSIAGTAIGMFIMFLLCRAGSFDTASVRNILSFMLLWTLPVLILSTGLNRQ